MLLAFVGDTHFGYKWGEENEGDSFAQARDAIAKALYNRADAIVQLGDLFDTRIPKPEVFREAIKVLQLPMMQENNGVRIKGVNKEVNHVSTKIQGIPFIAIHGTHDRRSKGLANPVEILDHAGFLIHLANSSIVLEKDGEKVAIHGMDTVPERYAGDALSAWNPQPITDANCNVLLFHQSFEEYIYSPLEPPTLNFGNMPKGFGLIVNGHIHWSDVREINNDQAYLGTGSTIVTQIRREDTERPKYVWFYDTNTGKISNEVVSQSRKIFFEEIDATGMSDLGIRDLLVQKLSKISLENSAKPIVKFIITGKPNAQGLDIQSVKNKFSPMMHLQIEKRLEETALEEKIKTLRDIREHRLTAEELGIKILRDILSEEHYDPEAVFKLLTENDGNGVLDALNDKRNVAPEIESEIPKRKVPVVRDDSWKQWFNAK